MPKMFWTYIVASRKNGTIYVGHTDDLVKRIWQHKTKELRRLHRTSTAATCSSGARPFDTREEAFCTRAPDQGMAQRAWKIQLIEKAQPRIGTISPCTINMWG